MLMTRLIPWLTVVMLAAGCASTTNQSTSARPSAAEADCGNSECFFAGNVRDFKVLDDTTLVVWASSRRCPYIVELGRRCGDMRFANTLGFDSRDNYVCSYGGDAVLARQGGGLDRCPIINIRRVSEQALEGIYVEYGLTDPVPTPPAEIEVEEDEAAGD
jgi:hypothetical protein